MKNSTSTPPRPSTIPSCNVSHPSSTQSAVTTTAKGNIKVVCRVRPPNPTETIQFENCSSKPCLNVDSDEKSVQLNLSETCSERPQVFSFDRIFAGSTSQQSIYDYSAKPVVQSVLEGYNGTVFAYGQTSSGKTHTMLGPSISDPTIRGVIPRMVTTVFSHVNTSPKHIEFRIKLSIVEIYLEKIRDLLEPSHQSLQVREDRTRGVYIQDVAEKFVASEAEVFTLIEQGNSARSVATTNMNEGSSRSHMLFIMTVYQNNLEDLSAKTGKLFLVDLAGSEKIAKTGAEGKTLDEAKRINQSLSSLGNVINALTDGKSAHVPYRDSKLTRILQESLGGNSMTTLIITCSPSSFNEQETLSTFRFGSRAKCIKNKPKMNRQYTIQELQLVITSQEKTIEELRRNSKLPDTVTHARAAFTSHHQSKGGAEDEEEASNNNQMDSSLDDDSLSRTLALETALSEEQGKCAGYMLQIEELKEDSSRVREEMECFNRQNEEMSTGMSSLALSLNEFETALLNNRFSVEDCQSAKSMLIQQVSRFRTIAEAYANKFADERGVDNFKRNQATIDMLDECDMKSLNKQLLHACQGKLPTEQFKLFLNESIVQSNRGTADYIPLKDFLSLQEELADGKEAAILLELTNKELRDERDVLIEQLAHSAKEVQSNEQVKLIIEHSSKQQFQHAKERLLEDLKAKAEHIVSLQKDLTDYKDSSRHLQILLDNKESSMQYKIDFLEKSLERMTSLYENITSKHITERRNDDVKDKAVIALLEAKLAEQIDSRNYITQSTQAQNSQLTIPEKTQAQSTATINILEQLYQEEQMEINNQSGGGFLKGFEKSSDFVNQNDQTAGAAFFTGSDDDPSEIFYQKQSNSRANNSTLSCRKQPHKMNNSFTNCLHGESTSNSKSRIIKPTLNRGNSLVVENNNSKSGQQREHQRLLSKCLPSQQQLQRSQSISHINRSVSNSLEKKTSGQFFATAELRTQQQPFIKQSSLASRLRRASSDYDEEEEQDDNYNHHQRSDRLNQSMHEQGFNHISQRNLNSYYSLSQESPNGSNTPQHRQNSRQHRSTSSHSLNSSFHKESYSKPPPPMSLARIVDRFGGSHEQQIQEVDDDNVSHMYSYSNNMNNPNNFGFNKNNHAAAHKLQILSSHLPTIPQEQQIFSKQGSLRQLPAPAVMKGMTELRDIPPTNQSQQQYYMQPSFFQQDSRSIKTQPVEVGSSFTMNNNQDYPYQQSRRNLEQPKQQQSNQKQLQKMLLSQSYLSPSKKSDQLGIVTANTSMTNYQSAVKLPIIDYRLSQQTLLNTSGLLSKQNTYNLVGNVQTKKTGTALLRDGATISPFVGSFSLFKNFHNRSQLAGDK